MRCVKLLFVIVAFLFVFISSAVASTTSAAHGDLVYEDRTTKIYRVEDKQYDIVCYITVSGSNISRICVDVRKDKPPTEIGR